MYFNLNPVNFLIISGIIQNFLLAGILFFRRGEQTKANKLLALLIIIVDLHLSYLMILDTNLDNMFPYLLRVPYSFLTATGPLIFLFTKTLTDKNFKVNRGHLTVFIPVLGELACQLVMIGYSVWHDQLYYNTPFYFYVTPLIYIWTAGSILYYLRLSLRLIADHQSLLVKKFSNIKDLTLVWLRKLIMHYRLLWVIWVPFSLMFLLFFRFQLQYLPVVLFLYLLMLLLTYLTFWIGLEGLTHTNFIALKTEEERPQNKNFSQLGSPEINGHITSIKHLMEVEKFYLEENLSLGDLSSRLKADPNLISFILNTHLKKNFYDFVNYYRIEEVKNRLQDPAYSHLTLLGIGLDAGFNSKTTFNRVFKQTTGFTPTEFARKNRGNGPIPHK